MVDFSYLLKSSILGLADTMERYPVIPNSPQVPEAPKTSEEDKPIEVIYKPTRIKFAPSAGMKTQ